MNFRKVSLFLLLIIIPGLAFAGPLFCPGTGVDVDVALSVPPIWFGTVNMPVIWMDQSLIGISLVPSFSFGGSGVHGYLAVEGMLVFSLSKEKPLELLLHAGGGLGGYYHDGRGEFLPVVTCGVSLLLDRFYLRMAADVLVMTKYYKNLDTYASITFGYGFGSRNR